MTHDETSVMKPVKKKKAARNAATSVMKPVKKKKAARNAATAAKKKLAELEARMAAFQNSLATLEAKTGEFSAVTPAPVPAPTTRAPFGLSERLLEWVTKNDMPTTIEVHRMLWAGVNGTLEPDQEELALLVRELTASRGCLLCGASSHASMAPGTAWSEVRLCRCAPMRAKDPFGGLQKGKRRLSSKHLTAASGDYVEVLPEWLFARSAPDGGIGWITGELAAGRLHPNSIVYKKTCRCHVVFGIRAETIARAVGTYGLHNYVESTKCLTCAEQAKAWRDQNRDTPHHMVPKKRAARDFDQVLGRHIDAMADVTDGAEVA